MIDVIAIKSSAEFQARHRRQQTPRAVRSGVVIDGRTLRVGAVVGCSLFWAAVISAFVV